MRLVWIISRPIKPYRGKCHVLMGAVPCGISIRNTSYKQISGNLIQLSDRLWDFAQSTEHTNNSVTVFTHLPLCRMCASVDPVSNGSDNGLSPNRRQAEPKADLLSIGPLGTNFSGILIKIQNVSFTKMHLKISSVKWRQFCSGGDELTKWVNCHTWQSDQHGCRVRWSWNWSVWIWAPIQYKDVILTV